MYYYKTTAMEIERIKRLPFVVKAYQILYPSFGTCGICGLPWSVCKPKFIALSDSLGTFSLCEHCWSKATLSEAMEAHTRTYIKQCKLLAEEEMEQFIKERPLEYVLQRVEEEYNKTK
jgi:hypothetical protein